MDIKIELRNIEALNKTNSSFDHGIKIADQWVSFATTRFVYSYFTFNYIFSIDWEKSFKNNSIHYWNDNELITKEEDQFKAYLKFIDSKLDNSKITTFSSRINSYLDKVGVNNIEESLNGIDITKRTKKIGKLKTQFIQTFLKLKKQPCSCSDFYNPTCLLVNFIYSVRCNLFHGSKNVVRIIDDS